MWSSPQHPGIIILEFDTPTDSQITAYPYLCNPVFFLELRLYFKDQTSVLVKISENLISLIRQRSSDYQCYDGSGQLWGSLIVAHVSSD